MRRARPKLQQIPGLTLLVCAAGLWAVVGASAQEPPPADADREMQARIERLIRDLDDDSILVREASQQQLIRLGRPVIAPLQTASSQGSPELKRRAKTIIERLQFGHHGLLTAEFARLAALPDEQIDMEEAMLLISKIIDPSVRRADLAGPLDELARAVQKRLGDTPAKKADPRLVMEALRMQLFVTRGFTGNRDNYNHPHNSSLARVLATKRGLPILLSHVVVSVGRRLEVPIVGQNVPGVFMAKYDGAKGPEGFPKEDIIVNAFEGRILTQAEFLKDLAARGAVDPKSLEAKPKKTLARMLTNLESHCEAVGNPRLAAQVLEYRLMLDEKGAAP